MFATSHYIHRAISTQSGMAKFNNYIYIAPTARQEFNASIALLINQSHLAVAIFLIFSLAKQILFINLFCCELKRFPMRRKEREWISITSVFINASWLQFKSAEKLLNENCLQMQLSTLHQLCGEIDSSATIIFILYVHPESPKAINDSRILHSKYHNIWIVNSLNAFYTSKAIALGAKRVY